MSREEIVVIRIGKKGLTEEVIAEIDNVLSSRGVVKVKLLKNFRELFEVDREAKRGLAHELAERLNATIVSIRGYTVVLRRPVKRRRRRWY